MYTADLQPRFFSVASSFYLLSKIETVLAVQQKDLETNRVFVSYIVLTNFHILNIRGQSINFLKLSQALWALVQIKAESLLFFVEYT